MSDFSQKLNGEVTILILVARELLARLSEQERKDIQWRIEEKLLDAAGSAEKGDFIEGAQRAIKAIFNPAGQESGT